MHLSKSDYTTYLKHPAWLWIKKHAKEMLPPTSDALQAIFDTGHEFEQYAEILFPGGVKIPFDYTNMVRLTDEAIESGAKIIFQCRFEHDDLTFIGDIIQLVGDKEVDLYEIKSSTSAKDEHKPDLCFQMIVLERLGYSVRNIAVIHVNNEYVRHGDIEPNKLCATTDVTEDVKALRTETEQNIVEALKVVALPDCPDTSPLLASPGFFKEWLEVYHHMKNTRPGSIYDLCQLDIPTLQSLLDNGYEKITDIPLDFALKPKQALQVQSAINGVGVDQEKINEFLSGFEYPLYFLDYETMGSLIPPFDGMRPFQQLPFQYSLHIIDEPGGVVRHEEFLHTENSNPTEAIATKLQKDIGPTGTVISWNMSFEKRCNDLLAELHPEFADFLADVNKRMQDLMTPFSKNWYIDSDFKGSASIKNVLPILVPELSHKHLNISDGQSAQRIWMQAVLYEKHNETKAQILDNLLEYCKLDTFAMVKIYQKLKELST